MRRHVSTSLAAVLLLASCHRGATTTPAVDPTHPLVAYGAQRVALTPTSRVRATDTTFLRGLGSPRQIAIWMDGALIGQLREHGLDTRWILPAELLRVYERNRTYATNPYELATDQLRPASFEAGSKLAEPLSSQLRTMIALHEDARMVLVPVELRFEGTRAVLRAALIDPRFADAKWVGEIRSDSAAGTAPFVMTQVAKRFVDLFVAP